MIEAIEAAPAAAPEPAIVDTPEPSANAGEIVDRAEPASFDLDAELHAMLRQDNPSRDEGGRFRSDKPAQAEAAAETAVSPDQPLDEAKEQVAVPVHQPPQSWSADVKAKWAALPSDVQDYVLKRERESHEAITRQGQQIKAYEPIQRVLDQHKDVFERNGVTVDDGVSRLLAAQRMLENDPVSGIATLAQAYGVDLASFGRSTQPNGNAPPEVAVLHREIAELKRQLGDTTNRIVSRERAEAQTQVQSMQSLIDKFSADKPDWAELESDVEVELQAINYKIEQGRAQAMTPEQKLALAYDRALRTNPEAWEKKQAAAKQAEEAKKVEEAAKRRADASRANKLNIATSPHKAASVQTIEDRLQALLDADKRKG